MTQDRISEKFDRASQFWHLERLYLDLANAKGRSLTPLEKQFLQGLLCGYSPAEIANIVYKNPNSGAVRVYLSNGLYRYIRELLTQKDGDTVRLKNWSCITRLLEKAGYRQDLSPQTDNGTLVSALGNGKHLDVTGFLGREMELERLRGGIQGYRLVTLLGAAGQGKTLLAAKSIQLHREQFEYVVWRSLGSQPTLATVLSEMINAIAPHTELPSTELERLTLLMNLLRSRRCLLVLDDFDGLFQTQEFAGTYQPQHQIYAQLLEHLASERHQSCCLLLSREQPKEVAFLAASRPQAVLELRLAGLEYETALQLPELQYLQGEEKQRQQFVKFYVSNTLVLKRTASLVNAVCQGDLQQFCQRRTYVLSNIREFLENQFQRLHQSEQEFLYSLVLVERLQQLGVESAVLEDKVRSPLDEIASLQRRLLLQIQGTTYQIPLLWQTYLIERLIDQTQAPLYRDRNTALLAEILHVSLIKPQFV
ncbi:MAG: NACHT domain-containing protein [Jaaginema sp. PMC 1079.18]|nr:NACHT domain-containing protein [Jaaginema sp. PMC 1080.18]MEC4853050.1 NACHT domain-containing protein [Jaaginema sp. PMC 1079.18]MEC4864544.1 NACHT domain-containing protein [Jaaginema sp. PMC 1078.18]